MIVANFYHIKSTNGLFFYGREYLLENIDLVRSILVRPELEPKIREMLPDINLVSCSRVRFLIEIFKACLKRDLIYTPTPHSLPFISRQWIVVHDSYPFVFGSKSNLKRILLKWSLSLSQCRVGYINRSDARQFVVSLGVNNDRMIFAPNKFPESVSRVPCIDFPHGFTTIGLMGTDSSKKNYYELFSAVRYAKLTSRLIFRVLGHDTAYFRDIRSQFPDIRIDLAKSDDESIDDFTGRVEIIASVSEHEGFGRPLASALLAGVPVKLLDRPVFREFFRGGAHFYSDIDSLVQSLSLSSELNVARIPFTPPSEVLDAYLMATSEARRFGSTNLEVRPSRHTS